MPTIDRENRENKYLASHPETRSTRITLGLPSLKKKGRGEEKRNLNRKRGKGKPFSSKWKRGASSLPTWERSILQVLAEREG